MLENQEVRAALHLNAAAALRKREARETSVGRTGRCDRRAQGTVFSIPAKEARPR
jgi:hypothetical protein